ncbi:hypothetical protein BDE36_2136 [Arcticibacter tournemirensis]|uniref:Uncharacterized protein n=1 Tax=Arcticibacter tournemirensis TaxID=699437 RepID=A0A5M9HFE4_9SPHI|nr:hypothetical protein [Arcticibacter tournemirensis]KAA8485323.1 hypothetical protein F1649_04175 [Arcticibacter tournemirensis]TQM50392.1 hypothetical protein BDE36_2136 [Arcticibacter tournemirensis]
MKLNLPAGIVGTILFFIISACTNPVEDIKIIIDGNVIKSSALIRIVDPQQPESVPANISLAIGGKDSAYVYEISGKKTFKVKDGMISIGLDPSRNVNESNPGECIISVSAPGYLAVNEVVSFTSQQSQQIITINLIKAINPPAGVSIVQKTVNLNSNTVGSPFSIETPLKNKKESVKASFSKGTAFMMDAKATEGKVLVLTLSHFDAHNPSSLQSFPGGFLSAGAKLPDGSTGNINFSTGGFFQLQLTVDNHTVNATNAAFAMSATLDAQLVNPLTNKTIAPDDKIGLWYFQKATGKWTYLKDITLSLQGGKLMADFTAGQTGWYSLCWYKVSCLNTLQVNIVTPQSNAGNRYIAAFFNSSDFFPYYTCRLDLTNSNTSLNYKNLPQTTTRVRIFEFAAFDLWRNSGSGTSLPPVIAESPWIESCVDKPLTLTIPDIQTVEITLEFIGFCPANPNMDIRPSMYIFYRESGTSGYQYLGYMDKGKLVTKELQLGKSYDFKSTYDGEVITVTRKMEQALLRERVKLPESTCKGF